MPPAPPSPPIPWVRLLTVVGVIAAAHLGLYLLLTASARHDVDALVERHGRQELESAREPGVRPGESADIPRWLRRQALWESAQRYRDRSEYVSMLGYGLLGSFLVQMAVTGVLLFRSLHRRPGRSR